ncbi:MAG: glycosyltransferase [Spirochaetales bacterium]|nr:glycosyltransferase [Spirochaetales bacterium]
MTVILPVVLFVYNRPEHTRETLEALLKNPEAERTDLWVFSDGPKTPEQESKVTEVRRLIELFKGFHHVELVKREKNFGLFNNIQKGLDRLFQEHEALIVLEDDLRPTPNFLAYMNGALAHYKDDQRVGSVCAYHYPADDPLPDGQDVFLFRRFTCWGWGSWRDRWQSIDWALPSKKEFLKNKKLLTTLSQASNDLPEILLDRIEGRNASWSIVVGLDHVKKNQYCVHPTVSKVQNIGFDGSGTHSGTLTKHAARQENNSQREFNWEAQVDSPWCRSAKKYFKNSLWRKAKNWLSVGRWF